MFNGSHAQLQTIIILEMITRQIGRTHCEILNQLRLETIKYLYRSVDKIRSLPLNIKRDGRWNNKQWPAGGSELFLTAAVLHIVVSYRLCAILNLRRVMAELVTGGIKGNFHYRTFIRVQRLGYSYVSGMASKLYRIITAESLRFYLRLNCLRIRENRVLRFYGISTL